MPQVFGGVLLGFGLKRDFSNKLLGKKPNTLDLLRIRAPSENLVKPIFQ
jgi:hypothetical protein